MVWLFLSITRFWWGLSVGVDWWDVVGCAQSAAEDDIGRINVHYQKEISYVLVKDNLSDDGKPLMLTNLCDSFVFIQTAKWEEYSQTTIL